MATTLGTAQQVSATRNPAWGNLGSGVRNVAGFLRNAIQGLGRNRNPVQEPEAHWTYGQDSTGATGWRMSNSNFNALPGEVPPEQRYSLPGGREQVERRTATGPQYTDQAYLGSSAGSVPAAEAGVYGYQGGSLGLLNSGGNRYAYAQPYTDDTGAQRYRFVDPTAALANTTPGGWYIPGEVQGTIQQAASGLRFGAKFSPFANPDWIPQTQADLDNAANFWTRNGRPDVAEALRAGAYQEQMPGKLNEGYLQLNLGDPATDGMIERLGLLDPSIRPALEALTGGIPGNIREQWDVGTEASDETPWWAGGDTGGMDFSDFLNTLGMLQGGSTTLNSGLDPALISALLAGTRGGSTSTSIFDQDPWQLGANGQPMTSIPTM